jgi:hypothetical protein
MRNLGPPADASPPQWIQGPICGVLYGVIRGSAYKIKKLAETEKEAHMKKGWWKD